MLAKAIRLYHTVKYLKLKQVIWRVIYLLPRFRTPQTNFPKTSSSPFINITKRGITKDYDHFTFLSEVNQLSLVGWDNPSQSKLWRYNLHYFDCLNQLELENEEVQLQNNLISKWIRENPFGKGTGWEPYPTSLRIINWIKWHFKTNSLSAEAKLSLWNQVNWLAGRPEYHLLGNHLFINAKALLFACVIFGLDEQSAIYKEALKILKEELSEQFHNDGAHFELSPMYHALAMQDLLDLYQLGNSLPLSFPSQEIEEKFLNGMNWLHCMSYSSGDLSHFNDCANNIAPTLSELKELGQKVGLNWALNSDIKFNYFKDCGFVVFKNETVHLIADIGDIGPDYLPGHAHADSLSFELAIKGKRIIVNSGTGEYGLSQERLRQRSTSAHSTIELDGKSSSEVWSGFRVAQRARITQVEICEDDNRIVFAAVHDGYTRIASKPIHKRQWIVNDGCLEIIDEVTGSQNSVQLRYYLHPDIHVEIHDEGVQLRTNSEKLAKIRTKQNVQVLDAAYHDKFGISGKNKCLLITGTTPFSSKVLISWN
uniref:heparinase II/III family protein n=1 Tax=Flavobacterium sp. TaxID=239 RepID=UPI00404B5B4F